MYQPLKQKCYNDIKMKIKGFCKQKGELYSGLLAHQHIHVGPDLGMIKGYEQRIPCGCISFLDMLREKSSNLSTKYQQQNRTIKIVSKINYLVELIIERFYKLSINWITMKMILMIPKQMFRQYSNTTYR